MYYLGDPCYIIPESQWSDFCEATFNPQNRAKGEDYGHIDSVIDWHGQKLTIWSNGGDGTWEFHGLTGHINQTTHFGVDAGIFCVIDLDKLPPYNKDGLELGILFDSEPNLYVEDGVVYINDQHDSSVMECENWECHRTIALDERMWCQYGNCGEGCDWCFECSCCDDCGEEEQECECGDAE